MDNSFVSPDLFLTEQRIKELEQPVSNEDFAWLESHGLLDNGKTLEENREAVRKDGCERACKNCGQPIRPTTDDEKASVPTEPNQWVHATGFWGCAHMQETYAEPEEAR